MQTSDRNNEQRWPSNHRPSALQAEALLGTRQRCYRQEIKWNQRVLNAWIWHAIYSYKVPSYVGGSPLLIQRRQHGLYIHVTPVSPTYSGTDTFQNRCMERKPTCHCMWVFVIFKRLPTFGRTFTGTLGTMVTSLLIVINKHVLMIIHLSRYFLWFWKGFSCF